MGKKRTTIESLNTENIDVGKMYSYKELCSKLNLPTQTGVGKKTQLEEINRYMKLLYKEKERKYKITRIYDEPKAEIYKYSSTNIYSKYLSHLILQSLLNKPGNTICMSITPLCNEFGFINKNYTKYYYNREELINKLHQAGVDVNIYDIDYIYSKCNEKFNQIVTTALDSLQRRKLIDWNKPNIVIRQDKITGESYASEANDKEIEILLEVRRNIMLELGCKEEGEIRSKGLDKIYYKKCNNALEQLTSMDPNIEYKITNSWNAYKIHYSSKIIPQALEEDKEIINKMCLNAEVMNFFINKTDELDMKYITKRQDDEFSRKLNLEIENGNFNLDEDDIVDFLIKDDVTVNAAISIDSFDNLGNILNNNENDHSELDKIKSIHNSTYELLVQLSPDVYEILKREKYNEKRRKK